MPISLDTVVHRIGGSAVENLKLKTKEESLNPPGISVFLGGTPEDAAEMIHRPFPFATRLLVLAERVGTATIEAIRKTGFDVIANPTRHFTNHARLIHPGGLAGFSSKNLIELSQVFQETKLELNDGS